jgi:RNA polymerase primary sigma factor
VSPWPANLAGSQVFPDVRDTFYQSDLRRIVPMDREEEFRMARRHEFLATLVKGWLVKFGVEEAEAGELVRGTSRAVLARVAAVRHAAWARSGLVRPAGGAVRGAAQSVRRRRALIVLTTVNRYRGLGVDTADLIQEGNASLFQAIDGFDWRRDVRFRTYAQYWVHQAVLKMLYNSSRTVRVPIWVQKILGKIRRVQEEGRRSRRELTHAQIAERIGVSRGARWPGCCDAPLRGQPRRGDRRRPTAPRWCRCCPTRACRRSPSRFPPATCAQALADAMADLPEREQRILHRRFGLDGAEPQTLGEIAVDLGITAERVRQLQNAAMGASSGLAKLRQLQAFVE